MKQAWISLKKTLAQYRKTIGSVIFSAQQIALIFSWFPALNKIKGLEIGEYPEEPAEIISARLQEMRPIIIRDAVIRFLLLTLLFFIIELFYWFKRNHDINLFKEIKKAISKRRQLPSQEQTKE